MKYFAIILTLFICVMLYSQTDLGEFLIEGKTQVLQDSVNLNEDLSEYNRLTETEKLQYESFITKQYPLPMSGIRQFNKAVGVVLGNRYLVGFNGVAHLTDIMNFAASVSHYSVKKDWNEIQGKISWLPLFNDNEFRITCHGGYIDPDFSSSKYAGLIGKYSYHNIYNLGEINFSNSNLLFGFNQFKQKEMVKSIWDVSVSSGWNYNNSVYGMLRFSNYNPEFMNEFSLLTAKLPQIDEGGIWISYYKDKLYFSLSFRKNFKLPYNMKLLVSNQPELSDNSLLHKVLANPYRNINSDLQQDLRTINLDIVLKQNRTLPFRLGYNLSFFQYQENFIALPDDFINPVSPEILQHSFWVKTGYEWNNLKIEQELDLYLYRTIDINGVFSFDIEDDFLPYKPYFTSISKLVYQINQLRISPEAKVLVGRKDENEKRMDDILLLNVDGNYILSENISINMKLENLLNSKYIEYSSIPAKRMEGTLQLIWKF